MSSEGVPSRAEVMRWSPQNLADFLRRMSLPGCDKIVLQTSMSGARFVNMTESDVLKFPKLHAPMISKLCSDINKKEERRGLFQKRTTTSKYREPDTPVQDPGWEADEFDEFESDDDYEEPDEGEQGRGEGEKEGEGGSSGGDYEEPDEEEESEENDYEPNPSEASEELPLVVRPSLPIGEGDYIDNIKNHSASRGPPPIVQPRPPASTLPTPSLPRLPPSNKALSLDRRDPFSREKSPGRVQQPQLPLPPMVERSMKPTPGERGGRDSMSPVRGGVKFNSLERPGTHSARQDRPPEKCHKPQARQKPPLVLPASTSVARSNSSARPPPPRFRPEVRIEQTPKPASRHHTFPPQALLPRPGLTETPARLGDSLPPPLPHGLPHLHSTKSVSVSRSSTSVGRGQQPPPLRPAGLGVPKHSSSLQRPKDASYPQRDLDPSWYVGKISRSEADHCLKRHHKDGSYLVRDGTKQRPDQPYTLMVVHQGHVYNVQIHMYDQGYLLGTGTNVHETFPTVRAMISHYSQTPLLLIDAKNRGASQQNQCLLSAPAGRQLT